MKSKRVTTKSTPKKSVKKATKKAPVENYQHIPFGSLTIITELVGEDDLKITLSIIGNQDHLAQAISTMMLTDEKFKNLYLTAISHMSKKLEK